MLILASQSPRRSELLRSAGIAFTVRPSRAEEILAPGEPAADYVRRLARAKASEIRSQLAADDRTPVLGADTVVVCDGRVLEKPLSVADARQMLLSLADREHSVLTGVCLLGDNFEDVRCAETKVRFLPIPSAEIDAYVASGEPMDKAGAYAIQGGASRWVESIDGCYFNVVGLPVSLVCQMLRAHDLLPMAFV